MSTTVGPPCGDLVVWALPLGLRIADRYRIQSKLGEGGMACVYRAHDERDDIPVALKVLDPLRGADPVGRVRFEREMQALSRLSHPAVARSLGATRHGDLEVLVLEFLEGETLATRLERGVLPVGAALNAALRLAEAISVCHGQGILHRDLKPANVMLHPDRGPVVLDFGVAWFSAAATLTRTGAVIGSPQYIAPEVLRTSVADPRADIYALGVILFEMLTGMPPNAGLDPLEWDKTTAAPSVFSVRPEVGTELSAVVAKAIAAQPEHRYATAREFADALRQPGAKTSKALETRLTCPTCKTGRILDLPLCPGCGVAVEWSLASGPYAVQLERVRNLDNTARWLLHRHGDALGIGSMPLLRRRLRLQPVPLAVGVSRKSAEQLASAARESGADASVVHTRTLLGPRLKASEASAAEIVVALGWHFAATIGIGLVLHLLGLSSPWLVTLPALCGLVGIGIVTAYTRRPLLSVKPSREHDRDLGPSIRGIIPVLSELMHERSRALAAQAFARAAVTLLSETATPDQKQDVGDALSEAVWAIARADAHQDFLLENPRSDLAHELEATLSRRARGDDVADLIAELEDKKRAVADAAVAYDVEVRHALALCQRMSEVSTALRPQVVVRQPLSATVPSDSRLL